MLILQGFSTALFRRQGIYIYNLDFLAYLSTSYIYTEGINLIILTKMIKLILTKDIKDDIYITDKNNVMRGCYA